MRILSESHPVAKKDYNCDSYSVVMDSMESGLYAFFELRQIVKIRKNNGKIKKGEKYFKQASIQNGELRTFRASLDMHEICLNNELYQDDF